ncbi:MAG: general secretion pathway protein GspK [Planctomycetes bacterium]|nr:general secretion pathway protein GspK [Planctomycetota bacterium]
MSRAAPSPTLCLRPRRSRGLVLVLVLGAMALLTILAFEVSGRANRDVLRAASTERESRFRGVFQSGLALATGILAERRSSKEIDAWSDRWQIPVSVKLDDEASVSVRVADESGKLRLPAPDAKPEQTGRVRKQLVRLFERLAKDDPEHAEDWRRARKQLFLRLGWNESKAPGASVAKPDPLPTLDGLREAGFTLNEVFGAWPADRLAPTRSLSDYLTVFGDGKLNLNTASEEVLYTLDEELDAAQARLIAAHRGADDAEPEDLRPFRQVKDLELVEGMVVRGEVEGRPVVLRNLCAKLTPYLSVQSRCFSVRIRAVVAGRIREAWAFFEAPPVSETSSAPRLLAFEELEP